MSAASALQRVHSPSLEHVEQARCGMLGGGTSTRAAAGVHHEGGMRYRELISCESCDNREGRPVERGETKFERG